VCLDGAVFDEIKHLELKGQKLEIMLKVEHRLFPLIQNVSQRKRKDPAKDTLWHCTIIQRRVKVDGRGI